MTRDTTRRSILSGLAASTAGFLGLGRARASEYPVGQFIADVKRSEVTGVPPSPPTVLYLSRPAGDIQAGAIVDGYTLMAIIERSTRDSTMAPGAYAHSPAGWLPLPDDGRPMIPFDAIPCRARVYGA